VSASNCLRNRSPAYAPGYYGFSSWCGALVARSLRAPADRRLCGVTRSRSPKPGLALGAWIWAFPLLGLTAGWPPACGQPACPRPAPPECSAQRSCPGDVGVAIASPGPFVSRLSRGWIASVATPPPPPPSWRADFVLLTAWLTRASLYLVRELGETLPPVHPLRATTLRPGAAVGCGGLGRLLRESAAFLLPAPYVISPHAWWRLRGRRQSPLIFEQTSFGQQPRPVRQPFLLLSAA